MNPGNGFVRFSRQNRAGFHDVAGATAIRKTRRHSPFFPQSGERQQAPVLPAYQVRLLPAAFRLPFVKAVGGNETASGTKGFPKRRFGMRRLGAGVDEPGADFRVARPARNEAPAEHGKATGTVISPHCRDVLARSNVVAGLEILRWTGKVQIFGSLPPSVALDEASAHIRKDSADSGDCPNRLTSPLHANEPSGALRFKLQRANLLTINCRLATRASADQPTNSSRAFWCQLAAQKAARPAMAGRPVTELRTRRLRPGYVSPPLPVGPP